MADKTTPARGGLLLFLAGNLGVDYCTIVIEVWVIPSTINLTLELHKTSCYNYDHTLTPNPMQAINPQKLGMRG
jgi:hypothetical protein